MEEAKLSLFIQNMMVTEKIQKTPQKYSQEMAAIKLYERNHCENSFHCYTLT